MSIQNLGHLRITSVRVLWIPLAVAALGAATAGCDPGSRERAGHHPIFEVSMDIPPGYSDAEAAGRLADGRDHLAWGHWSKAAADFRRALRADPNLAEAHFNLGLALERLGDQAAADEHFRTARDLAPQNPGIFSYPKTDPGPSGKFGR